MITPGKSPAAATVLTVAAAGARRLELGLTGSPSHGPATVIIIIVTSMASESDSDSELKSLCPDAGLRPPPA